MENEAITAGMSAGMGFAFSVLMGVAVKKREWYAIPPLGFIALMFLGVALVSVGLGLRGSH